LDLALLLPEGLGWAAALVLVVASFFTSALTASFGVGGGVAMLTLLGLFIPVAALIPVHGAVQLGSNTGRAWRQRANVRWQVAGPFVAGSVLGAIVGAFVVVQLPDAVMKLVLGLFVVAITWTTIPGFDRLGRAGISLASAVLAVLSMMLGATGPLLNAVLAQIIPGDRKALVATHAAGMTVQHLLKIVVFGAAGFAFAQWLPLVAAMIVTGYLGTIWGTRLLDSLPEDRFRFWFKILLTVLALDLARRGAADLLLPAA
jgi:uncharacterized membrane protein YfcA